MTVEDKLIRIVTECERLFTHLWPIALGEPVGPDGHVYQYGDNELAEWVIDMFTGEVNYWPWELSRHTSGCKKVWNEGRTLTVDQVSNLSDEGWEEVREALLSAHPELEIHCPNCGTRIKAREDEFHEHYINDKCWDTQD